MSEFAVPSSRLAPAPLTPIGLVGAASPFWAYYYAAAAGGLAWWLTSQWARPANLEALFAAQAAAGPAAPPQAPEPPFVPVAESLSDRPQAVTEIMPEAAPEVAPVAEPPVAAAPESAGVELAQAIVEPVLPPEPVGGEAAPVSPLVKAAAPAASKEPRGRAKSQADESKAD